jgi:signal transduction histidine kinase
MTPDTSSDLADIAGRTAHDFKNLLAIVLANAELLQELATDEDALLMLRLIREAAERGDELANTLASAVTAARDLG